VGTKHIGQRWRDRLARLRCGLPEDLGIGVLNAGDFRPLLTTLRGRHPTERVGDVYKATLTMGGAWPIQGGFYPNCPRAYT
jgi:hypothetical protein